MEVHLNDLASTSVDNVPATAGKWVSMLGLWLSLPQRLIVMDALPENGGRLIYDLRTKLPAVALRYLGENGEQVYPLVFPLIARRNQDGSDLALYNEIIEWAKEGRDKDEETCKLVTAVDWLLVKNLERRLAVDELVPTDTSGIVAEMRRMKTTAMFNVCTIWREGRQR